MNPNDPNLSLDLSASQQELDKITKSAAGFGNTISNAFAKGVVQGRQFGDILKSVAMSLEQTALKAAIQPLANSMVNAGTNVLDNLVKTGATGLQQIFSLFKFADGGVINTPHYFPVSGGLGVAGEAGPEAIMPLARGSDGKLGVRSGAQAPSVTVNVQIATPDTESFRRSEAVVSAQLARAVARGQRGL
jgi:phage-related minor tail protein